MIGVRQPGLPVLQHLAALVVMQVRSDIIRSARIKHVGKSQSCMVSKLRIIWKQTVALCSSK